LRSAWLIAKSVLIEAIRKKEIYAIILVSLLMIGGVMTVNFFEVEGLSKFFREIALRIMSISTALTVIILASRQLPREFKNKTIYPLLAKPVGRAGFISGKLLGVMLSALFCFFMFMIIFVIGSLYLGTEIPWIHFIQYIYLQMLMMAVLTSLSFFLSLIMNLDAAITIGVIIYLTSSVLSTGVSFIYDYINPFGKTMLVVITYVIPQMTLFDFSGKTVHALKWAPLGAWTLVYLTLYALFFTSLYYTLAILVFRRRAL
jgi:ABC-type transport system involved in multi-copper enzyme maturation permease subunit